MTRLKITWPVAVALVLVGCATALPPASVLGRPVEVKPAKDVLGAPVKGELLAVSPEKIWVMGPDRASTLPLRQIEEVRVPGHGLNARRAGWWVALGALVSGTVLALACSSVEGNDSCGRVFIPVLVTWGALGVPSAKALADSSQLRVKPRDWDKLRPYARFPQGLPDGLDPLALAPPPATAKP
jgi:hypothetical protein